MQQKLVQVFVISRSPNFENSIEKKPQKPRPKLKNICTVYIYRYLLCLQFNASGSFFAIMY